MQVWHWWIMAGVGLLILEVFTPGFVAASFGLACFAGALAAWLGGGATWQVAVFTACALVVFVAMRPFFQKAMMKSADPAKLGAAGLSGRTGLAEQPVGPGDSAGRVKLGGEVWRARSESGQHLPSGARVSVVGVEGATLVVSPQS